MVHGAQECCRAEQLDLVEGSVLTCQYCGVWKINNGVMIINNNNNNNKIMMIIIKVVISIMIKMVMMIIIIYK